MERTLIILKPDAVKRKLVGEVLSRFERKGLNITHLKMQKVDPEVWKEHYAHLKDKPFFGELVEFMSSSPVVMGIIEGNDVIELVRLVMGKTKVTEALPGTIRGDFAFNTTENLIHGSDLVENAEIEIKRFFPELF